MPGMVTGHQILLQYSWINSCLMVADSLMVESTRIMCHQRSVFTLGYKHKLSLSIANAAISNTSLIVEPSVTFNQDLKFSLIHRCFISRSIPNLVKTFNTYVHPLLEYAPQIKSLHQSYLITLVMEVQRTFTKGLPGFSNKNYLERLAVTTQSLEHRCLISDLVTSSSSFILKTSLFPR